MIVRRSPVVSVEGDRGNVPGPEWGPGLSQPSAEHVLRGSGHHVTSSSGHPRRSRRSQRTDDLRPRAWHQLSGLAGLRSGCWEALPPPVLCVPFLSAAFEERGARTAGRRPEWALSPLRTPGWRLGRPEAESPRCGWFLFASWVSSVSSDNIHGEHRYWMWLPTLRLEVPGWGGGGRGEGRTERRMERRRRVERRREEEENGEEQEGEKELERSRGRDCPVLEQGLSILPLKAFRKSGFLLAEESLSYLHSKGRSCSMTQGARYHQNENIFRRQEVSPPACPCLYSGRSRLESPSPSADGQAAAG